MGLQQIILTTLARGFILSVVVAATIEGQLHDVDDEA